MIRQLSLVFLLAATTAFAQTDGVQKGKIAKIDPDKLSVTITVDGKDHEYVILDSTTVLGVEGKTHAERLKSFKVGMEVMFKPAKKDGKDVLVGLKAGGQADGIQKGKLARIDLDKPSVTITADGKDHEYLILENTTVFGSDAKTPADRLKNFKVGMEVMFKPAKKDGKDGKDVLAALKAGGASQDPPPPFDTSKLKPLTEMGQAKYQGFEGGLYPEGKNIRPESHEMAGLALAKEVRPLDAAGKADAEGKIVLLSVGMSNTSQASESFGRLAAREKDCHPSLVFVNGAQGGMTARLIQNPQDGNKGTQYWKVVDDRLKMAGVTAAQVQAIWIKQADGGPSEGFPKYAQTLSTELEAIVRVLPDRFPSLKLVYVSSRTYGGYATTRLNPEPYAFESGYSVKWLIERQLKGEASLNFDPEKGPVKAPWLSWGPYLWANGTTKRADGYFYEKEDYGADGTHPSRQGQDKIAGEMLRFFKEDSTTRLWFLKGPTPP